MKRVKTTDMVITAVFAALICVFSLITIPTPFGVPVTLQTFIIALTGFTLGSMRGVVSVFVYIAVGMVGLPVFSGFQGGLNAIFGITGGFIVGFVPFVCLCGLKGRNLLIKLLFSVIGLCICHFVGIMWVAFISGNIPSAFLTASAPFLIKDIISIVLALLISKKIVIIIQKFN